MQYKGDGKTKTPLPFLYLYLNYWDNRSKRKGEIK
jgi:hypothetical protein